MKPSTGLWVYCVIKNKGPLQLEAKGIHGDNSIYTVSYGDFSMVVSEEPMQKYPLARDYLIAHQLVNEKVMQTQPVLPAKFCTMAESAEQIIEQVLKQKERTQEFNKAFAEVDGKSECGVRAWWKNLDQVFSELGHENQKINIAKEKALKLSERERHALLIDIGHLVKEALEEKNAGMAETLFQELAPRAVQYKRTAVFGDMNILNAAFLVDKRKQAEFDKAIGDLAEKWESQIQFRYVAPVPPFNFVEIVIRWDDNRKKGG